MKTIKNTFLTLLTLLFVNATFVSCSNDEANLVIQKNEVVKKQDSEGLLQRTQTRYKASDFEQLGVIHNNILEDTYNKVYNDVINNNIEITDSESLTDYLTNHISRNYYQTVDKNSIHNGVVEGINIVRDNKSIEDLNISNNLTVSYLNDLEKIIIERKDVENKISQLEKNAHLDNNLKNSDLAIIFSATSIGKYSYQYWSQNLNNWLTKLNTSKGIQSVKFNVSNARGCSWWQLTGSNSCLGQLISSTTLSDVYGGIGGAVGAAVVNLIPGAGQVAYATAIVTVGVGASVVSGLNWLQNHFNL